MADEIRRDESAGRDASTGGNRERSSTPGRQGSPLGTDPQESSPLPGDPREAQEPQEPPSTPIGAPGREDRAEQGASERSGTGSDHDEDRGVVDQLRDAWDRMRGKR